MAAYAARRLAEIVVALVAISTLIYLLIHLRFGGVCTSLPTGGGEAQMQTSCVDYFHLNRPFVEQYTDFVGNYLHGNFGASLEPGLPAVTTILSQHLPATALLLVVAFLLQQAIALPLGILAAVHRYSIFDGVLSVLSYVILSVPAFIVGLALIWYVGVDWGILPASGAGDVTLPTFGTGSWLSLFRHNPGLALGDTLRHLLLPAITLAVVGIAVDSRFMRAAMLHELDEEYIRTARAKGLRPRVIVFKHALRNALAPIISNLAVYFPALLGSAIVVEYVFNYQGIGYTLTQAIVRGNTPVEQAIFVLMAASVLLANLLADIAYKIADPRVEYR